MTQKEREEALDRLMNIPRMTEKAAEALCVLGITSAEQLREKDPVKLYEELRNRDDFYAEPCLLNTLKIVVRRVQ